MSISLPGAPQLRTVTLARKVRRAVRSFWVDPPVISHPRPRYGDTAYSPMACYHAEQTRQWYDPVLLTADTVGRYAVAGDCLRRVNSLLREVASDDYTAYLLSYYDAGMTRFGDAWEYADITTVLLAAAELLRPMSYLEIGVRRGRSMAVVATTCPDCEIVGFDFWQPDYAGMENSGPEFVRAQLGSVGHRGALTLVSGDSHVTVPRYVAEHPNQHFDLITVDGDHTQRGAWRDLCDVLPHLKVGGILVFDDICNPHHPGLKRVWDRLIGQDERFSTWSFDSLGFGVSLAMRRW